VYVGVLTLARRGVWHITAEASVSGVAQRVWRGNAVDVTEVTLHGRVTALSDRGRLLLLLLSNVDLSRNIHIRVYDANHVLHGVHARSAKVISPVLSQAKLQTEV